MSNLSELSLINKITQRFPNTHPHVIMGIGDDAAVLQTSGKKVVISTDTMQEGIDFDTSYISSFHLGFKIVSINVSDIYAMGAKPLYILLNLSLRKEQTGEFFDNLLDGLQKALNFYNIKLIGGDLSSTLNDVVISATVIGETDTPVLRSGAKVGDRIYVTGSLGDSACGLYLLQHKINFLSPNTTLMEDKKNMIDLSDYSRVVSSHFQPIARDTQYIAHLCSAMIDISDGLSIDLHRICSASAVGAVIYKDKIPLSNALINIATRLNLDPYDFALGGGEDYEILFTTSAKTKIPDVLPYKITCIGEITNTGVNIVSDAQTKPLTPKGYEHFSHGSTSHLSF